jgi:hypothetical protein
VKRLWNRLVARPYRRRGWTDAEGARRWAVVGPEGAIEVCDLAGQQGARAVGLLVVHVYSPGLPAELAGAAMEPDPACPYVPDGAAACRRQVQTAAESPMGAAALEMAGDPRRGLLWLFLATMYGVTFADRRVVGAVLRGMR